MAAKVEPFWQRKKLAEMSVEEWESLCDGCGKCCLVKLQDEDDDRVYYTNVACRYLDSRRCQCQDYPRRLQLQPDCLQLKAEDVERFQWLPSTCAYRLIAEGKDLPPWHHLQCGDRSQIHKAGVSVKGLTISETQVHSEDLENYIIRWVD